MRGNVLEPGIDFLRGHVDVHGLRVVVADAGRGIMYVRPRLYRLIDQGHRLIPGRRPGGGFAGGRQVQLLRGDQQIVCIGELKRDGFAQGVRGWAILPHVVIGESEFESASASCGRKAR